MINELIFAISLNANIYIPLYTPIHELHLYAATEAYLSQSASSNVLLDEGTVYGILSDLQWMLFAILRKENTISKISFEKTIGYWENELLNDKICCRKYPEGPTHVCLEYWAGMQGKLWGTGIANNITYMYIYEDEIYLEVAPIYPWSVDDEPNPEDNHISYEEFIKSYKPIARFELSQRTIKEWLLQAMEVINIIRRNEELEEDVLPPDIMRLLDDIA